MWSFIGSAAAFVLLVVALGLWQYRIRKNHKNMIQAVDQEIHRAAEVAQRRHKQRYGKEDTGLHQTLHP